MNLLIIGATGSVGSKLLQQALARGHRVTALVRDPSKITLQDPRLVVIRGDVMEPDSLPRAFRGQDVVLSALGAGGKGGVRAAGTCNIIAAMQRSGVRRFISLSSLGVGDSSSNLNFFWKYIMFGLLLRRAFADHVTQERHIRQSDLDWTIVRPGAYTDGRLTGRYRHGFAGTDRNLELKISRADVADFMLRQLEDSRYLHRAPGVSY